MKFNLFKKENKTAYVPKRDPIQEAQQVVQTKNIRELAIDYFDKVESLDDVKEILYRSIKSKQRVHTLIVGPPASAKSLLAKQIEEHEKIETYFCEGAATTKAGIQKYVSENQQKKIIIIDELDKLSKVNQEGLLTMMERGEFTSTKCRNTQTVKADIVIYATSNSIERLTKPLRSRFEILEIGEYNYEQFESISVKICPQLPRNLVIKIAANIWRIGSKDVRNVLRISKLARPEDSDEDIDRLIAIHEKHKASGKEYN